MVEVGCESEKTSKSVHLYPHLYNSLHLCDASFIATQHIIQATLLRPHEFIEIKSKLST